MIRASSLCLAAGILTGSIVGIRFFLTHNTQGVIQAYSSHSSSQQREQQEVASETPPSLLSPSSSPPRCAVILKEVTKDRFIHYLLRPAAALGAAEVVWLGVMAAKATMQGLRSPYGKAMRKEATVPLKNLTNLFQARRHLSTGGRGTSGAGLVVVVGVALESSDIEQGSPTSALETPPVFDLMTVDFVKLTKVLSLRRSKKVTAVQEEEQPLLSPKVDSTDDCNIAPFLFSAETESDDAEGDAADDAAVIVTAPASSLAQSTPPPSLSSNAQGDQTPTIAFLFSGPAGKLTSEEVSACDAIVTVIKSSSNSSSNRSGSSPGGSTSEEVNEEEDPPINISALMAIVLHQFITATSHHSTAAPGGGGEETVEKFTTKTKKDQKVVV